MQSAVLNKTSKTQFYSKMKLLLIYHTKSRNILSVRLTYVKEKHWAQSKIKAAHSRTWCGITREVFLWNSSTDVIMKMQSLSRAMLCLIFFFWLLCLRTRFCYGPPVIWHPFCQNTDFNSGCNTNNMIVRTVNSLTEAQVLTKPLYSYRQWVTPIYHGFCCC